MGRAAGWIISYDLLEVSSLHIAGVLVLVKITARLVTMTTIVFFNAELETLAR